MNRKSQADLTVGTIVEFILLAIVIIVMLMRINQESSSHRFDKKFLSKDMGMFVDALYSSPNTIIARYPQNTYDYSFVFEDSKVSTYWSGEDPKLSETYFFTEDPNVKFKYKTISNTLGSATIQGEDNVLQGMPIIFMKSRSNLEPFAGLLVGERI